MRQITCISHVLIPVRIDFCMATCCCRDRFNYGIFILVIDPTNFVILGAINVKKLHGKSITMYLWSHQIQDALWHQAYSYTWHIPSSFKTGRHSQWWLSMLHLMLPWAQLHRQSLSISTYSCLSQSIQLQLVLCVCWHVAIILAITVIMIIKWHWHLDTFNGLTTLIVQLGVTLGFALVWQGQLKSTVAQSLYRRSSARSDISCV